MNMLKRVPLLFAILYFFLSIPGKSQVNLNLGLVASYPFNGNANDASGNNHHGTLVNGITLTADRFGNANSAYHFDGIDDYIKIADDGAFSTPQFSMVVWFQSESNALQNLIAKRDYATLAGTGGAQYQMFINYPPYPGIGSNIVGNNSTCNSITTSSYLNTGNNVCSNKWICCVITFDGSRHKMYINGELKRDELTGFTGLLSCKSELRFGNWFQAELITFKGVMDDIRWYNRALNKEEVDALFDGFPSTNPVLKVTDVSVPCGGGSADLTLPTVTAGSDAGLSYTYWRDAAATQSVSTPTSITTAGTYYIKANAGINCSVIKPVSVNFNAASDPDFVFEQNLCNTKSVTFKHDLKNVKSAVWTFGDGASANGSIANHAYAKDGTYKVELSVEFLNGCKGVASKLIPIQSLLNNNLVSTTNTTICLGDSIELMATSEGLGFCWQPQSSMVNVNTLRPKVAPDKNTTYYLYSKVQGTNLVTNGDFSLGNTGFSSQYTEAFPNKLEAQYWVDNNSKAWNINFNDCKEHTSGNGKMMMVNGSSISGAKVWSQTVSVLPNTNYSFSVWIQSLAALNPARLKFSINNNVLGDDIIAGNTACEWKQYYTVWNSGNATSAIITIVNNNTISDGNDFAIDDISFSKVDFNYDSVIINVASRPNVKVGNDMSVCEGQSVQLGASGATVYSWSPATSVSDATIANPTATPTTKTQYIVSGYDVPGCVGKDTVTVDVLKTPSLIITNPKACIPNTIDLTDASITTGSDAGLSYSYWNDAAGSISIPLSQAKAINASGAYYISATNSLGCSRTKAVIVSLDSKPQLKVVDPQAICAPSTIDLSSTFTSSTTGLTITYWKDAATSISLSKADAASIANSGQYYIKAENGGCSVVEPVQVTIKSQPVLMVSNPLPVCEPYFVDLTDPSLKTGSDPSLSYSYYLNNTQTLPLANPKSVGSGIYYIKATGTNGCTSEKPINVTVKPKPSFSLFPLEKDICKEDAILMNADGGELYEWFTKSNSEIVSISQQYSYKPAITDSIFVVITSSTCQLKDTLGGLIRVKDLPNVTVLKSNDIDCQRTTAQLKVSGGISYQWSPNTFIDNNLSSNPIVNPLEDTWYKVKVADANSCIKEDSVLVHSNLATGGGKFFVPNAFSPNGDGKNDCFGVTYWSFVKDFELTVFDRWGKRVFYTKESGHCWDGTFNGKMQPLGTYIYQIKATSSCSEGPIYIKGHINLIK